MNRVKLFIASILISLLVLPLAVFSAFAGSISDETVTYKASVDDQKTLDDKTVTFESYADNTPVKTGVPGFGISTSGVVVVENGLIKIPLQASNNKNAQYTVNALKGIVGVEVEVNFDNINAVEDKILNALYVGGTVSGASSAQWGVQITYNTASQKFIGNSTSLGNETYNGWIKLGVLINLATEKIDYYINDEYIISTTGLKKAIDDVTTVVVGSGNVQGDIDQYLLLRKIRTYRLAANSAPTVSNITVKELNGVLTGDYIFNDADGDQEGETVLKWMKKASGATEFVDVVDSNTKRLTVSENDDGAEFKFCVTPVDDKGLAGSLVESSGYMYTYTPPVIYEKPEVTINVTAKGATFEASYSFTSPSGLGEAADKHEFGWYMSDDLFEGYTLIADTNSTRFTCTTQTKGKFLKFGMVPVDEMENRGELTFSNPVVQNGGTYLDFESELDIASGWGSSNSAGGAWGIAENPNGDGHAIYVMRDTNSGTTKLQYDTKDPGGNFVYVDVDYLSPKNEQFEMFYFLIGENPAFKVVIGSDGALSYRGDDPSNVGLGRYTANEWHHMSFIIDKGNQTITLYIDGELKVKDKALRFPMEQFTTIRSYNSGNAFGSVYFDNLTICGSDDTDSIVNAVKQTLNLSVADISAVTEDIALPTKGDNGSVICWESDDTSVISKNGKVKRPLATESDKEVTLTAHILLGTSHVTKEFKVNVLREFFDAESVAADARALETYKDTVLAVDKYSLPAKGKEGSTYTWVSSDQSIVKNDGTVIRDNKEHDITFSVTVKKGTEEQQVEIPMSVWRTLPESLAKGGLTVATSESPTAPAQAVNDGDMDSYWESRNGDTEPKLMMDLSTMREFTHVFFAEKNRNVDTITIQTSEDKQTWNTMKTHTRSKTAAELIEISGKARYIRFVLTKKDGTLVNVNEIQVLYIHSDERRVDMDRESLEINSSISSNFTVPTNGENGSKITWTFSNDEIMSLDGSYVIVKKPKNDTTVTITATLSYGEAVTTKVFYRTVPGSSNSSTGGSSSSGSGSAGSSGANALTAWSINQSIADNIAEDGFYDLDTVPWAKDAIVKLSDVGIVQGISEKEFKPNETLKREEFVALITRAFQIPTTTSSVQFDDVSADAWYAEDVAAAQVAGIVNGINSETFGVGQEISRQDMAVILLRAMRYANIEIQNKVSENFADQNEVSAYAQEAVSLLASMGIVNGTGDNYFSPKQKMTRAQCCVALARIPDIFYN